MKTYPRLRMIFSFWRLSLAGLSHVPMSTRLNFRMALDPASRESAKMANALFLNVFIIDALGCGERN
jgi:hypothetical protein